MPLPTSGIISASMIRDEFEGPSVNVRISDFLRAGSYVPDIGANASIRTLAQKNAGNTVNWSHYRGGSVFGVDLTYSVSPESIGTYGYANNGSITLTLNGSSPSYRVVCSGAGVNSSIAKGVPFSFGGLNGTNGAAYTMTITDNKYNYTWNFSFCVGGGAQYGESEGSHGATAGTAYFNFQGADRGASTTSRVISLPKYGG